VISVSDTWKAIQKDTILPESFVEVTYWITDHEAQELATESNNGDTFYSNSGAILDTNSERVRKYATLESNLWLLDGTCDILADKAPYGNTGYVADAEYPMVTIALPQVREQAIPGLTIVWSESYGEYATRCRITALRGTEVIVSEEFLNNSAYSTFHLPVSGYDKFYIEIIDWLIPDHRPRIERVYLGIREVYTKAELLSYSHTQSVDLLSTELPKNEIVFSLDNSSDLWNPDNPAGIAQYLLDRQSVSVRYGYKIDDDVEWIPGGTFWLSEWNTPSNGLEVTFTARDLLEFMDVKYSGARSGTLYFIAESALNQVNIPKTDNGAVRYSLDESLKGISTDFSEDTNDYTVAVILQMVANAGQCVMYQDRNGILRIEKHNKTKSDYEINQDISYTHPERTLTKPPQSVFINGNMAGWAVLKKSGESIEITNPVITQNSNDVCDWAVDILQHRNLIRGTYRSDPRLDVLDVITVESKYSQNFTAAVTEIKYDYNGAFHGEYVGREIEV
jgi:hypothetical protein